MAAERWRGSLGLERRGLHHWKFPGTANQVALRRPPAGSHCANVNAFALRTPERSRGAVVSPPPVSVTARNQRLSRPDRPSLGGRQSGLRRLSIRRRKFAAGWFAQAG